MIPRTAPRVRVRIAAADHGARRSLTTALSPAGFEVTAVDDGEPAIALAGAAAFEIVDLHRTTGGLAVIPHDKQRHGAGVYCAVLSGEDDEATREAYPGGGSGRGVWQAVSGGRPPPVDRGRPRAARVNGR